jgi:hypothetical protein
MPLTKPASPAAIAPVPTPVPSRNDRANFRIRGDAMMGWFQTGISGINNVLSYIGLAVDFAEEQLTLAVAAAMSATTARDDAIAASGAGLWVTGTVYSNGTVRRSPADPDNLYMRQIVSASPSTVDPNTDTTGWRKLVKKGAPVVTVTGTNFDCSTSDTFKKTISGNTTLTFNNFPSAGLDYSGKIEIDHVSGAITWPVAWVWAFGAAPTLVTGRKHLVFFTSSNAGATVRASVLSNYTA